MDIRADKEIHVDNASSSLIKVKGLSFRYPYRRNLALKDVSFAVQAGAFFCCLGPNGAGKSTIVKLLTGRLRPTPGCVWIMDNDIAQSASQTIPMLGILTDDMALPGGLTVEEVLVFTARGFGCSDKTAVQLSGEVIAQVQMDEHRKVQIRHLSAGLRRRVEIGQALINRGRLIFLDEPTVSLDPAASREIRQLIKQIHAQGTTIFYTTHLLHEVEELGTDVLIIDRGQVVLFDNLQELRRRQGEFVRIDFGGEDELMQGVEAVAGLASNLRRQDHSVLIPIKDSGERQQVMDRALEVLQAQQVKIAGIRFYQEGIEEIYQRVVAGAGDAHES